MLERNGPDQSLDALLEEEFRLLQKSERGKVLTRLADTIDTFVQPEIARIRQYPHLFYRDRTSHLEDIPGDFEPSVQQLIRESFQCKVASELEETELRLAFFSREHFGAFVHTKATPDASKQIKTYESIYIGVDMTRVPVRINRDVSQASSLSGLLRMGKTNTFTLLYQNKNPQQENLISAFAQTYGSGPSEVDREFARVRKKRVVEANSEIQALRILANQPQSIMSKFDPEKMLLLSGRLMNQEELRNWTTCALDMKSATDSGGSIRIGKPRYAERSDVSVKTNRSGRLFVNATDLDHNDKPNGVTRIQFPVTCVSKQGSGYQICEIFYYRNKISHIEFNHGNSNIINYDLWMNS